MNQSRWGGIVRAILKKIVSNEATSEAAILKLVWQKAALM